MKRKLVLRRESLTELTTDESRHVVGGTTPGIVQSAVTDCLKLTCGCLPTISCNCWDSIASCYLTCGCQTG
jgi:hypothetical protein